MDLSPATIQIVQLVAYTMLTLASVTVATVSALFAYRNNFGWKPLALATSKGLLFTPSAPYHYFATIAFEVWNRRKYPVVIRHAEVRFATLKIVDPPNDLHKVAGGPISQSKTDDEWHRTANSLYLRDNIVLAPSSHHAFVIKAAFPKRTLDDLRDAVTISVRCFDPRLNRLKRLKIGVEYTLSAPSDGMFKKLSNI